MAAAVAADADRPDPPAVPQPDKGHLQSSWWLSLRVRHRLMQDPCPRGAPRSKVITYHRQFGEVARVAVSPDMVKETA